MINELFNKGLIIGLTIGLILTVVIYQQVSAKRPEDIAGVDVEATVLKISLDNNDANCAGKCVGYKYPRDKAIIRIDTIKEEFFRLNSSNIKVGDEIEVNFLYSARPAKLIGDINIYHQLSKVEAKKYTGFLAKPIPINNGYFIYKLPIPQESEKTLPGLKEGNIIRIKNYNPTHYIGEYEILS